MAAVFSDTSRSPFRHHNQCCAVVEEIPGLIKVYKDGRVERPQVIPSSGVSSELGVTTKDVAINESWARFYVPSQSSRLPLLIYFHGGGFCVGSASWRCYNDFLANLASKAGCVIMSVNYHLAPENRLPIAYEDGVNAILWVKQHVILGTKEQTWWLSRCDFASLFIGGDSAGANIAHHVTTRLASHDATLGPLCLKGTILIQPFFGGEARTESEKHSMQPPNSALTLSASDTYWRLSLPVGANRDHPWCNPLGKSLSELTGVRLPATMICIADLDILKDRNLELCAGLASAGKQVEMVIYKGVGHAFQVLHNYPSSRTRTREMMSHLKAFINR